MWYFTWLVLTRLDRYPHYYTAFINFNTSFQKKLDLLSPVFFPTVFGCYNGHIFIMAKIFEVDFGQIKDQMCLKSFCESFRYSYTIIPPLYRFVLKKTS